MLLVDALQMNVAGRGKSQAGFTLIEVMIVVMILGLLMSIAIPHFIQQRANTQAQICINNLRKIEDASSQFALEYSKKTGDSLTFPGDLTPYIKLNAGGQIPPCPAGGTYSLSLVGIRPVCSLGRNVTPEHELP